VAENNVNTRVMLMTTVSVVIEMMMIVIKVLLS